MKLGREFYERDTLTVAKELLGKILVHDSPDGITKGTIVEVEAYCGYNDAACHSYKKNRSSGRTNALYYPGGYAYVYLIYGMYNCFNVVSNAADFPEAVLIRAIEPLEGIELMKQRRNTENMENLCSGPGKLCKAMAIDRNSYGLDLCGDILYIEEGQNIVPEDILPTKRINIDYSGKAKDYLWRFVISKKVSTNSLL